MPFLHCTWKQDSSCSSSVCEKEHRAPREPRKLPISPFSPSTVRVRGTRLCCSLQRASSWPFACQPQSHLPLALKARKVNKGGVFISIFSPPSSVPRPASRKRPPLSAGSSALLKPPALYAHRPCCQGERRPEEARPLPPVSWRAHPDPALVPLRSPDSSSPASTSPLVRLRSR